MSMYNYHGEYVMDGNHIIGMKIVVTEIPKGGTDNEQ